MKAVIIHGPHDIRVEKRPRPSIQEAYDAVVRVIVAGICGSELHPYRGHQKTTFGHIMGHEFTGIVEDVGSLVTTVKKGDRVIGLFSSACLRCWFCKYGHTNRCARSLALGTAQIDGSQAEYVRVPDADGTLLLAPVDMEDDLLVMMSDIFPTGYYGAMRAMSHFAMPSATEHPEQDGGQIIKQPLQSAVIVCLGCGIVGLCAIMTAVVKGTGTVFCVDSVEDRLEQAKHMGGIPLRLGVDDIRAAVMKATDGRGADAVIESVGNQAALGSGFELLRPCGVLSSVGFHQTDLPFTALQGYQRNIKLLLSLSMGRAPVRAVLEEALKVFVENKSKFVGVISHRLPLVEAAVGYKLFDTQEARKVVLRP
ncbi:Zinc-dependent alcohol dehydrogenase [Tolypocladium paradoxum]|uniref:Zinc-dependent alcohol dehydrogenase n=1 Tax=Tolypocladium paradoxum TaxID=94208 RepID=A0A2S4KQR8_9HYPO|nr:Zinc-dependent alcohol dehydrogenase [Tolypocladium paradoxum]